MRSIYLCFHRPTDVLVYDFRVPSEGHGTDQCNPISIPLGNQLKMKPQSYYAKKKLTENKAPGLLC